MGDKDIVSKEIIKEIGRDISMHILGIDIKGEVTTVLSTLFIFKKLIMRTNSNKL